MSLKELPLPSIASLRAIAALKSPHLALVRPARIGLGFELTGAKQKTLAEVEQLLGGPGRLSLPYSLRWLLDVMNGLGVLHRTLSFVHGEVQPEHLVLGEDGVGRLIPVVRAHWVRGEERAPERLYYLAPEKLLGDRVDVRSDVFSLGVLLWEALAGQRLLDAHDVDDIIARLMGGGIPRVVAPEAEAWTEPLAAIAERALAVDPGRRFASVAEMSNTLQSACSRYLASPPGMAELFQNPERRARNRVRDSLAPESQRATLPPLYDAANSLPTQPPPAGVNAAALEAAAAARRSLASVSSIDLEEETTTKPRTRTPVGMPAPVPPSSPAASLFAPGAVPTPPPAAAPTPVVTRAKHINTLLGVPPPFVDRESSPDAITQPFARIPTSTPVLITPLPVMPPASRSPAAPAPTPWGPPIQMSQPASAPPPPFAAAQASRPASLSPLIAAPAPTPNAIPEPSFELMRPRKNRGALWLLLGAAVAIGAFAARPWLARQVAAASGALPDNAGTNVDLVPIPPVPPPPSISTGAPSASSSAARVVVGIASTPPVPSGRAPRVRGGAREEHIVIHDSLEPQAREPAAPTPTPRAVEPTSEPVPVAPPTSPPATPPPTPKPKSAPVSEADQYGI